MAKRHTRLAPAVNYQYPLTTTPQEAGRIAEGILWRIMDDADEVGRFLLLCHVLAYTTRDREDIMVEIERRLAPHLAGFTAMLHAEMDYALGELRKGARGEAGGGDAAA